MTYNEETHLLETMENIKRTTDENNQMLQYIVSYINHVNSNANNENISDFIMNVIANIISNKVN